MFGLYSTLTHENDDNPKLTILKGPNYYDSPEGTDPIGKLWGINKYAVITGLCTTGFDCVAISNVTKIRDIANVAGFWFPPLLGCASAFASVTYIATDIRKKDDKVNYILGALACGPVLHLWRKNMELTCWFTAAFIIAACLKKDSIQNGWEFIGTFKYRTFGNYLNEYDKSIITEEWPKRPY